MVYGQYGPYGPDKRTIRPRLSDYTAQICGPYGPHVSLRHVHYSKTRIHYNTVLPLCYECVKNKYMLVCVSLLKINNTGNEIVIISLRFLIHFNIVINYLCKQYTSRKHAL